jgi:hypothetical protein
MSDFFTKKQRKYWCDKCRVFIEYTKIIIEQHNKSKNHLRMINADKSYLLTKNRIMKHIAYNYDVESNPNFQNYQSSVNNSNFLQNKTNRDSELKEFDYSSGYKNFNSLHHTSESSLMLEEIKKDKMREIMNEKFKIKPKQKQWGMFWDSTQNLPYYFNFITNTSQWEKPENFDGVEIKEEINENVSRNNLNSLNEGIIGKWEEVKKEESFFEKYKAKGKIDRITGEISKREFYNFEYGIEYTQSDHEEEEEFSKNKKTGKDEKSNLIDKIIKEDFECENISKEKFFEPNKEELIKFNKQLKKNDFDLKDVNQLYYGHSDSHHVLENSKEKEINLEGSEDKNPDNYASNFSISFNKVKKNSKKISSIFLKDDAEEDD